MKTHTVRAKLIRLLLIMGIIPLIVLFYLSFEQTKTIVIEKTGFSLQELAVDKAGRTDLIIDDKMELARSLSSHEAIQHILQGSHEKSAREDVVQLLKINRQIQCIALVDAQSRVFFQHPEKKVAFPDPASWWDLSEKARKDRVPFLSRFFCDPQTLKITANIVIPVAQGPDGADAYVVFLMNMKEFVYLTWTQHVKESALTLFRDDGFVLLDTSELFGPVIQSRDILWDIFLKNSSWKKDMPSGTDYDIIFGYSGLNRLNELLVEEENYYFMLSMNEKEVLRPVLKSYFRFLLIIIPLMFIVLMAALCDVNRMVSPLLQLKEGADLIGSGNLDHRMNIKTEDEIEDLADAFNQMTHNLKISKIKMEMQNKELASLNEIKSNFLSLVSHELRTPLMIIQESVSQVLDGIKGPITEEQKEFLSMTKRNIQRLTKIIGDLLNISRIESGKLVLKRHKVDIAAPIREELELYLYKARDKGVTFNVVFPDQPVILFCDEDKIKIIVANLVSNALKFTPAGKSITIELRESIHEVEIIVSDTGQGIPREHHEKIFEKFERLNRVPLVGAASTGLGLAITRELVHLHKGKIWLESEPDKGSRFHVLLRKYTESRYFKEFFREKIHEAQQRSMELSLIILRLSSYENKYIDPQDKRKLFSHLVNISFNYIFDYEEIIPLKNMDEIYAFLFTDTHGAEVIVERLNRIISDYLTQKKLKSSFLVNILSVTLPEDGRDHKELLRTAGKLFTYVEPIRKKSKRLGEMLLEKNLIRENELKQALQLQEKTGRLLGRILIEGRLIEVNKMAEILGEQLGIRLFEKKESLKKEKKLFQILPKDFIIKHKVLPLELKEKILNLAMVNPFDMHTIKKAFRLTGSQTIVTQLMMDKDFESFVSGMFFEQIEERDKDDKKKENLDR